MTETVAPDFVTPPSGPRRVPVTSIVPTGRPLGEGIKLFLNQDGHGFILEKESDGLWLAPVENTTVAAARGGSTLRHKRWAEGDSHLVLSLHSPSPESMYDMFARLVEVVTNQGDYFDLVVFDPYSQEARRRTFLYDSGLEDLGEVTGTYHTVGVTAKFLSPFWRGPERVVTERIAPPVKPLITADPGSPVNRWDDPEFEDTTAYEPWFVVDGGLEKQGTGDDHGTYVSSHRIEVSPGETVSLSADLSYVGGPEVGGIQIKVRVYDDNGDLVEDSESTVISEDYPGTYVGTYDIPETGVEIELGFYTDEDVHANTRVRLDSLDVKREVQYIATYEWEGEPYASPSIKRDSNGEIVARNDVIGYLGWDVRAGNIELQEDMVRLRRGYTDMGQTITVPGGVESVEVHLLARSTEPPDSNGWQFFLALGSNGSFSGGRPNFPNDGEWHPVSYSRSVSPGDEVGIRLSNNSSTNYSSDIDISRVQIVYNGDSPGAFFDGDTPDELDQGSVEGAYSFPFFPVFFADSTVQGEHELVVEGDAPVWPVWEIQGPGKDVEIIGPDGSRLFVEGEVISPITIVTEPGKRSIRDASGLIWERMKPGDDQFFALEPGEQVVKMTMVGGNPESTIKAVYSENWKTPRGTAQGMIRGDVV